MRLRSATDVPSQVAPRSPLTRPLVYEAEAETRRQLVQYRGPLLPPDPILGPDSQLGEVEMEYATSLHLPYPTGHGW